MKYHNQGSVEIRGEAQQSKDLLVHRRQQLYWLLGMSVQKNGV